MACFFVVLEIFSFEW